MSGNDDEEVGWLEDVAEEVRDDAESESEADDTGDESGDEPPVCGVPTTGGSGRCSHPVPNGTCPVHGDERQRREAIREADADAELPGAADPEATDPDSGTDSGEGSDGQPGDPEAAAEPDDGAERDSPDPDEAADRNGAEASAAGDRSGDGEEPSPDDGAATAGGEPDEEPVRPEEDLSGLDEFGGDLDEEGRAPLDDIAREVEQRRERDDEADDDLFQEMGVEADAIDGEAVWEDLLSEDEETDEEGADGKAVGAGAEAELIDRSAGLDDRPEHEIPKDQFCGRCPFLGEPPELTCTNEGTDIIAVPDSEHFRVRGCPFAAQENPAFDEFG